MDEFVNAVAQRLAVGDLDGARAAIAERESSDPLAAAIGRAALALFERDAAACEQAASRALALAPDDPMALRYLALARLMRGDALGAETHARRAAELDPRAVTQLAYGNILLGAEKPGDALGVFRRVLEREPKSAEAMTGIATASYKLGRYQDAILHLSRAWECDPESGRPIEQLIHLFVEAGKMLGAAAALRLARQDAHPDEVKLALDMVELNLTKMIAVQYPQPNTVEEADRAVRALSDSAAKRSPTVQIVAARALAEVGRMDDARAIATRVAAQPLAESDRASLLYLDGYLAGSAGDKPAALEAYRASVAVDASRADSATNAISLLLERGDEESFAAIAELLARVPTTAKVATPGLLFNEAVFLQRSGRTDEARRSLQQVLAVTGGQGPIADLARRGLAAFH